jgi:hypothetical protein
MCRRAIFLESDEPAEMLAGFFFLGQRRQY